MPSRGSLSVSSWVRCYADCAVRLMGAAMPRPSCGINIPGGTSSTVTIVVGTVGTVFSIAGAAASVMEGVAAGSTTFPLLAAAVAGVAVFVTVIYFAVERCNQNPK